MNKWIKYFLIVALIALIVIQFIHPDHVVPEVKLQNDFISQTSPPEEIKSILKTACYDCHSYETKYPWYDKIQPVSFWLDGHVNHARQKLNFSTWGDYTAKKKDHKLEECIEFVEKKWMPLKSYTWAHGEARLTDDDRKLVIDWFSALRK